MLFAEAEAGTGIVAVISAVAGAVGGSLLQPLYNFLIKKKQIDASSENGNVKRLENRIRVLEEREMNKEKDYQTRTDKLLEEWGKQEREWESREHECQKNVQRLERELGEMKGEVQTLRRIVERVEGSQHIGIVVADEKGIITAWNQAATFILEWDQKEMLGQSISLMIPPRMRGQHNKAYVNAVQTNEFNPSRKDTYALTRRGVEIPINIAVTSFEDGSKKFFTAEIRKLVR